MHDVDDSEATTKHKTKGKKGKVKKREWWTNSCLVRGSSFNAQKLSLTFLSISLFFFTLISLSLETKKPLNYGIEITFVHSFSLLLVLTQQW